MGELTVNWNITQQPNIKVSVHPFQRVVGAEGAKPPEL